MGVTMDQSDRHVCVIGCGRGHWGDDQVGLKVADKLAERHLPGVTVIATESPVDEIFCHCRELDLLIIVDAAQADETHGPGSFQRIDYHAESHRVGLRSSMDTHTISVDAALALARELDLLPPHVWIYAVAVADVGPSPSMSPIVEQAWHDVVHQVRLDIKRFLNGSSKPLANALERTESESCMS
jgi:hydrogenase maturation protease